VGADAAKCHQTLLDMQERAQEATHSGDSSDSGTERLQLDADDIFFTGISNNSPTNDNLPETLKEVFARPDRSKWKSA
jgi:hypothetical protein